ncbi:MAG: hypothetical protein NTZ80_01635 [Patescibacteria group bacterium]|nr:hypothetical protein [Patescibacteria group bacterium]
MINIPEDIFFDLTLEAGSVYYYFDPRLKKTEEPHYFVVLSKSERIILVCATSQFEKRKKWVERCNLQASTLVIIAPDKNNGLKRDSLFDCNYYFEETRASLKQKHKNKPIRLKGRVSCGDLARLISAMKKSRLIPKEIKDLL